MKARVYVSGFGQIWKDVLLLKADYDSCQSPADVDTFLKSYFAGRDAPPFIDLVARGSVYFASYCDYQADQAKHDQEWRIAKSVGGHAPSSQWTELLYPELERRSSRLIFRRITEWPVKQDLVNLEHQRQGEKERCSLKKRQRLVTPVRCFLRIHLSAPVFDYNPQALESPLALHSSSAQEVRRELPLSEDGHGLRCYYKPPGCLSEPHVACLSGCLPSELQKHLGRDVHPVHRLDCPVSGIIACRVMPEKAMAPATSARLKSVELAQKVYLAVVSTRETKEQIVSRISSKPNVEMQDDGFTVTTYCPPGNLFDRASPVFMSSVEHPGWKSCKTFVRVHRTGLKKTDMDDGPSVLLSSSMIETALQHLDGDYVEFSITLLSGRRHQIRSVMAYLGYPLALDSEYEELKDFDLCDYEVIKKAEACHSEARSKWFTKLREIISDDTELLKEESSMWSSSDSLLQKMRKKEKSDIIGLCAHSLTLRVDGQEWTAQVALEPWWNSFLKDNGC